jgi:hypothetical protein
MAAMSRAVVIGLLALIVAAGCGGSSSGEPSAQGLEEPSVSVPHVSAGPSLSRQQYFAAVRGIVEGAGQRASTLFQSIVSELPPEQCAESAQRFERVLDRIVDEAESLSPPAHVAELHRRFVVAAREAVDGVRPALRRAQAGELACGEEMNSAVYGQPATARAEALVSKIEAKGYVIFGQ